MIRELQQQNSKPFLRVRVLPHDTTGFLYDLSLDDKVIPGRDYMDESDRITIVVDKGSAPFVQGATIDWQTRADGRQGFHFDNPNAVQ